MFLLIFSQGISAESDPVGTIQGQAIDINTKESLLGANILLIGTSLGASTNPDGAYKILSIGVGSYSVKCTYLGYSTQLRSDVIVKPGRVTQINFELSESAIETGGVTVTPSYFESAIQAPVSATTMSREEIRRAPGTAGDVSRIIMSLPSVAKVNDTRNSLVVRGGSPLENGYYVDGIPIPNINHFPSQGASGGAIGLLNIDFIEDVKFHAGGFGAEYGDRLSSITDIRLREGSPTGFEGQVDLSFTGVGAVAEGPLSAGNGSWMFAGRRSYFDLIVKAFDVEASTIPEYCDLQGKLSFRLNDHNRLTLLDIHGLDNSVIERENSRDNEENVFGEADWLQNTIGINWQRLWGRHGYTSTSLAHNYMRWNSEWSETVSGDRISRSESTEQRLWLRNKNHLILGKHSALDFGAELQVLPYSYNYLIEANTDAFGNPSPEIARKTSDTSLKTGAYVSIRQKLSTRLTVTPGVRYDYFDYGDYFSIEPRALFAYQLTENTTMHGAYGRYYQFLPLILVTQFDGRNLENPTAAHYILGFSRLVSEDTRLTVEAYAKEYVDLPLDPDQPLVSVIDESNSQDGYTAHDYLESSGAAYTRGIELMLQKKLADKVYGIISGSLFRSRYRDYTGAWRDRDYDNRFLITIEGGFKPNRSWEFSMRWVYAGGAPYTPFDSQASAAANTGIQDDTRINEERRPDYHTLNLRLDRRFHYRASSLIAYLSIWNAYGRENIASYYWNEVANIKDSFKQWGTLPVIGFEYEF
jgi:hypothetical protein